MIGHPWAAPSLATFKTWGSARYNLIKLPNKIFYFCWEYRDWITNDKILKLSQFHQDKTDKAMETTKNKLEYRSSTSGRVSDGSPVPKCGCVRFEKDSRKSDAHGQIKPVYGVLGLNRKISQI